MGYREQAASLQRHVRMAPFTDELNARAGSLVDEELCDAIIEQAARFAETELDSLGSELDREGATLVLGEVRTSVGQIRAWEAFREAGWLSLSAPAPHGQGLPQYLVAACEELFNRASAAFFMLPTATRCGASLLLRHADGATRDLWVPKLLAGEWTATICISEPDAGSDVGRIRTRARPIGGGESYGWAINGEKCWISFGSHDLAPRIGHLMLARTSDQHGVRGLSLFLVPSTTQDGAPNGVVVRRIEEKLGLHGSPTCALGFENAAATLIGEEGRGLQQMFHMMLEMRLSCGPQGTGVATAALDIAMAYALERKQGGRPNAAPVPISDHPDVQRQLLSIAGAVEMSRALNITCAQTLDLAQLCEGQSEKVSFTNLAQFLLPIVKDGAAWTAFNCASQAIQVLGGAGYTSEWPLERLLRDSRVFPIYEGTTGMQALDILHRRVWKDGRAGLDHFMRIAQTEAVAGSGPLGDVLDLVNDTATSLGRLTSTPRVAEAGAVAWLELCKLAVHGWLATRIVRLAGTDPVDARISAAATFVLSELEPRARLAAELAVRAEGDLAGFQALSAV
ncbi:MAG: acyl-CoA dehydrogenase family protein [Novosphingobium sp.]|nr:acyl-CoA dehydrogenase family protein [Novosphingobium sp.]